MLPSGFSIQKAVEISAFSQNAIRSNQDLFKGVQDISRRVDGEGLAVVHPCYYYGHLREDPTETIDSLNARIPDPKNKLTAGSYPNYLRELSMALSTTDLPIFLFFDSKDIRTSPEAWTLLQNITPKTLFITVLTIDLSHRPDGDPFIIQGGNPPDNESAENILIRLGFRSFKFMGEFNFRDKGKPCGCVPQLASQLGKNFNVSIDNKRTFPNVDLIL